MANIAGAMRELMDSIKHNDTIRVGSTVSWWEAFKNQPKLAPRTMTGTVISLHGGRNPWAGIAVSGMGRLNGNWVRYISTLTRVTPSQLVQAAAELPRDDTCYEDAVYSLRVAGSLA